MARVSKRSNTFFRLSPAENLVPIGFSLQQGDVEVRLDPNFHLPNPDLPGCDGFPTYHPSVPLSSLIIDIIQPKEFTRVYVEESSEAIPCLRAANVRNGELNLSDLVFVPRGVIDLSYQAFETSFIHEGDILITRTGAKAGETCVVPSLDREFIVSSHSIRIIPDRNKINPKYLELFLLSRWGKAQIYRLFTGAAQKQLQLATIIKLEIVVPPFPEEQQRLVSAMDEARSQRKQKRTEADTLLSSLDDYLLNTLGLNHPVEDDRKAFAVQNFTATGRFDPHFYAPNFKQINYLLSTTTTAPLGSLVSFSKETWQPDEDENSTFRYIEISNVRPETGEAAWVEVLTKEAPSRARMVVHDNDIIVSLTRPHHGSIAYLSAEFDGCIVSTGFAVIRSVGNLVNREYLWCILRSQLCLQQMLQRSSGGNYPAIIKSELENIIVPLPDMSLQQIIVAEIHNRREEARRLRSESDTGWQEAKKWFEEQLLGSVSL
jgi:type I restriction enzyme, S subunit